jgi:antitoxin (DNA-binding transcriptional repressor) of toxin-antitoxin stability system
MEEEIVPASEFKETCLALLDKVKNTGRPILVTRQGEPIALISRPPQPGKPKSWLGSFKSKRRIGGDIITVIYPNRNKGLVWQPRIVERGPHSSHQSSIGKRVELKGI